MKKIILSIIILAFVFPFTAFAQENLPEGKQSEMKIISLPTPQFDGNTSIEKALNSRRSIRGYSEEALSIPEMSQILWAAQGITKKRDKPPTQWLAKYEYQGGNRTAPSAGGLFPIELYLVASNVKDLSPGVYKYIPKNHSITKVLESDIKMDIFDVALKQEAIKSAQAILIICAVYERTEAKYHERTQRYVHMEVGAVCENVYLQGISLGIGAVMIGAFNDEPLKNVLQLPQEESPLGIMPLGKLPKENK